MSLCKRRPLEEEAEEAKRNPSRRSYLETRQDLFRFGTQYLLYFFYFHFSGNDPPWGQEEELPLGDCQEGDEQGPGNHGLQLGQVGSWNGVVVVSAADSAAAATGEYAVVVVVAAAAAAAGGGRDDDASAAAAVVVVVVAVVAAVAVDAAATTTTTTAAAAAVAFVVVVVASSFLSSSSSLSRVEFTYNFIIFCQFFVLGLWTEMPGRKKEKNKLITTIFSHNFDIPRSELNHALSRQMEMIGTNKYLSISINRSINQSINLASTQIDFPDNCLNYF